MMPMEVRKRTVKELKELRKLVGSIPASFDALQDALSRDNLFKKTIWRCDSKGEMSVNYDNLTLTFYLKNGIITVGDIVSIWDDSGTGFIGSFTARTLQMESSGELD